MLELQEELDDSDLNDIENIANKAENSKKGGVGKKRQPISIELEEEFED